MAAQHNYSITFKSLRAGTVYTLTIGGSSGNTIPLKGGAQPFTTQEDYDEDMFVPIRTQSGYLRVVDDGKDANGNAWDWKDLIPATDTSRPVTLTRGGTVVWRGFMQAQDFGSVLYGNPQEREFPVQCQLSVLSGFDVEPSGGVIEDFGYILSYIFSKAGTWGDFYFQGGNAVGEWLRKMVSWILFASQDDNGILRARYNCYQVLEDICAFWGWTCRISGQDVWFTSADDTSINSKFQKVTLQDLVDITRATPTDVQWQSFSVAGFVSTNNTEDYMRGVHHVTVNADIDKHDNIFELPMEEIDALFDGKTVSHTQVGNNHYFEVQYYPTEYENSLVAVDCYWDQDVIAGRFMATQNYEGNIADLHNYSFVYGCRCFGRDRYVSTYCMKLVSKYPISFDSGALTINGDIDMQGTDNDGSGDGYIYARLRVGDLWWNGSDWSSTASTFTINVKGGKIADTRSLNSGYVAFTGLGIGVQDMGGLIEFYCLGSHSNGTTYATDEQCNIKSLSFGFARLASSAEHNSLSKNVYTATNNSKFAAEKDIELIFASDNGNSAGYGIIMNPSGSYCDQVNYGTGSGNANHPEQHLANRIASLLSDVLIKKTVELNSQTLGTVTPGHTSEDGYPIAISHEWRDDVTQLTILQL